MQEQYSAGGNADFAGAGNLPCTAPQVEAKRAFCINLLIPDTGKPFTDPAGKILRLVGRLRPRIDEAVLLQFNKRQTVIKPALFIEILGHMTAQQ